MAQFLAWFQDILDNSFFRDLMVIFLAFYLFKRFALPIVTGYATGKYNSWRLW